MLKKFLAIFMTTLMIISLAACGGNSTKSPSQTNEGQKLKLTVWGVNPLGVGSGNKEMIDAFNNTNSNIELVPQSVPGTTNTSFSTQDSTKVLAAIAAGTPPDIFYIDRFTVPQYAARGALTPIDQYIKEDNLDMSKFYGYTLDETKFDGQTWALPWDTDVRVLFWNKDVFKEEGLDPEKPPTTWDELLDYSKKLTKSDSKGNITRIGFIPNYGNSRVYLWGFLNGAKWLSPDGKTALLNSPEAVGAMDFMVKCFDAVGGATKVNAYVSTFQTEANDPFLQGYVAMVANTNSSISRYLKFKPNLNFGTTFVPVPKEGQKHTSYSGGWAYAIPKGAKHPKESFAVIKWLVTQGIIEQQKGAGSFAKSNGATDYIPFPAAYLPSNDKLKNEYVTPIKNETIKNAVMFSYYDAMKYTQCRPVSPTGEIIFSEQQRVLEKAIYHELTPQKALDAANGTVQAELDKFWSSYKK